MNEENLKDRNRTIKESTNIIENIVTRKRGLSRTIICLNSNNREQLIFLLKEEIYLCLKVEINPNNYMLDLFVKIISFSLYLRRKDFIAAREREILKFLG